MAPGAFSLLGPLLGLTKSNKKYEKLETEDPEKRKQEATQEEIKRLNNKIEKLVHSMSRDDFEIADTDEDKCIVCCQAKAVMQVAPCGHICQCRLCFVHTIKQAIAARDLPLKCLVCNAKVLKVKNSSALRRKRLVEQHQNVVHTTDVKSTSSRFPKSASGYSIGGNMAHSSSNYSMSSGISSMSNSSYGSRTSVRSAGSTASGSSWFSIGSLSNFQADKVTIDSADFAKPPRALSQGSLLVRSNSSSTSSRSCGCYCCCCCCCRSWKSASWHKELANGKSKEAHSLSSCGKSRQRNVSRNLSTSNSSPSIVSKCAETASTTSEVSESEVKEAEAVALENEEVVKVLSMPSPRTIDRRIRVIQGYVATNLDDDEENECFGEEVKHRQTLKKVPTLTQRTRLQVTRENFRRSNSDSATLNNNAQGKSSKTQLRRLNSVEKCGYRGRILAKSPDVAETTFTMTTILEENEIGHSLRNLSQLDGKEE